MRQDNIESLRNELNKLFHEIKQGGIEPHVAAEMNNSAGKIIASLKVQLEYAALRKESPTISFLESDDKAYPII